MTRKKISVLVVDDSMVFREIISRGLRADDSIEYVITAKDAFEARDKIIEYNPDVMTCDIEMPKMDGIEFITRLMPQHPMPIIVVSGISDRVFDAMKAGAVEFITKPNPGKVKEVQNFIYDMISKIKIAFYSNSNLKLKTPNNLKHSSQSLSNVSSRKVSHIKCDIIAIGASTGGTEALFKLLKSLPRNMPGIVVVQHIPPVFSNMFAERLDKFTDFNVKEAAVGDCIDPATVLVAPGDKHMVVRRVGDRYKIHCYEGEKVNGHCPSVDVLFESVAKEAKDKAIGIILTGMGYDGAKGLLAMKRKGAITIGQDEKSSVVYGMPKVAYNIGAVNKQLSLDDIGIELSKLIN